MSHWQKFPRECIQAAKRRLEGHIVLREAFPSPVTLVGLARDFVLRERQLRLADPTREDGYGKSRCILDDQTYSIFSHRISGNSRSDKLCKFSC